MVRFRHPHADASAVDAVLTAVTALRTAATAQFHDQPVTAAALTLSLRQILRVCRHAVPVEGSSPTAVRHACGRALQEVLLLPFLSDGVKAVVGTALGSAGLAPGTASSSAASIADGALASSLPTISVADGVLRIGSVTCPVSTVTQPELVPRPVFFNIPSHVRLMEDMLSDIVSDDKHLLLIGNQGVGKNKIADRLLQLLQCEREYIQLHRDSTIQSLTVSPVLIDGIIRWEDSPLVRAAKFGRTLVVDEVDKASVEVVCVLKSLLDGEMTLSDGR